MFFPTHFEVEIIILSYQKMFSGIFTVEESHHTLNICPRHRADFGIRWRTRKTLCTVPKELAVHKCGSAKGSCRANSQQSENIFKNTGILIPVGSRKLIIFQCQRITQTTNSPLFFLRIVKRVKGESERILLAFCGSEQYSR